MNINEFEKNISNYLDGDLKPSEMKDFEELLKSNIECQKKINNYKIMLERLSSLDKLTTSSDFMDKLNEKIDNSDKVGVLNRIEKINIFGYDYISVSGMAAALIMFIFSITIFTQSNNVPLVDLDNLSTKNIDSKASISDDFQMLSEDDSLNSNQRNELPIQLVGGKK